MRKRGQEEIMGFVMIVVVMAIVFLIFLGIFIRRPADPSLQESKDISRFLESMMQYTSRCAISYEPDYSDIGDLMAECYDNPTKGCLNGESVCDVLNSEIKAIIDKSWQVGEDRPVRGYILNSTYTSGSRVKEVLSLSEGDCSGSMQGAEHLIPAFPGTITSTLRLCS